MELNINNFNLQISESLVQFTAARVCFQTGNKDNGSCLTVEENITTERILRTRKHWDSKSKGWRVMKVLQLLHQLYHSEAFLRINLTSFYSLQYALIRLLPDKERSQEL